MKRLAHRIRHGHWPEPWDVFLMNDTPAPGCRACIKAAVMDDLKRDQRPYGKGF